MKQIESFANLPLRQIIPSYLYKEYSDDEDLQAFVSTYNGLSQGYLTWFLETPLAVYTNDSINDGLLEWSARGIYNIRRPILSTQSSTLLAGYNQIPYNRVAYNQLLLETIGTAQIASDDIYKRVLTWHLYRGDGQVFCLQWLKNRINRFLNGINGTDTDVLDSPPSIVVSGTEFTIQAPQNAMYTVFKQCLDGGILALPFQYQFIAAMYLTNNGGLLQVDDAAGYPTSDTSLPDGGVYSLGGLVAVAGMPSPDPSAPTYTFSQVSAASLLLMGAENLPITSPPAGSGILWNNGGLIYIA